MNELITVSLNSKDISHLVDFPPQLMTSFEKEIVNWIIEYEAKYESTPTIVRVKTKFTRFIPIAECDLPLADVYQETLSRKLSAFALDKITEAETIITSEGRVPFDVIEEISTMAASATGVYHYDTFDRSQYFRERGLPLGFRLIDRVTGGLAKGDFCLIVGRLGTGKSTVAQWVTYQWWAAGARILYVSNETLAGDVFAKLDAISMHFNPLLLRTEDRKKLKTALAKAEKLAKSEGRGSIMIPKARLMTPGQVAALAKSLAVDAIIIDGVYLMQSDGGRSSSQWEKIKTISNALKQHALDIGIPILGITQLKRGAGDSGVYDTEDIAYSDALGQDADFVLAIRPGKIVSNRVELQLIKNRFGPELATVAFIDFEKMEIRDESVEGDGKDESAFWKE